MSAYTRSLELNLPEPQVAHYNIGLVHERLNDKEAAAQSYGMALELAPEWTLARERLDSLER